VRVGTLDVWQRQVFLYEIGKFCAVLELGDDGRVCQTSDVVYRAHLWELGYLPYIGQSEEAKLKELGKTRSHYEQLVGDIKSGLA